MITGWRVMGDGDARWVLDVDAVRRGGMELIGQGLMRLDKMSSHLLIRALRTAWCRRRKEEKRW